MDQGSFLVKFKEDVMVSITDGAVTKFKEVVTQQGTAGDGIRIFLVPGG
jgi:Fe-S cluster assembly iron-binding protein IscA